MFPGSGALWEVFSLQSTGCFLSRQAMRNFCRVLISQIKCIKRWCRQPSLTQIRLCTAKPLHAATDRCNWQPKVAAKSSSLLRRCADAERLSSPCRISQRVPSLAPNFLILIPPCYTDSSELGVSFSSGQSHPAHPWIPQFLWIPYQKLTLF